jgi:hypothetical protein
MAIVIRGETKCQFCGKVIVEGQEAVSFPNFVANQMDPLSVFSDGAFHAECFHSHPLAQKAQGRYEEVLVRNGPGNRVCVVCEKEIIDPDEYFTFGHLIEDESGPVYRYNYVQAHSSCLPKWRELAYATTLIQDLKDSGTWQGKALGILLAELREAMHRGAIP